MLLRVNDIDEDMVEQNARLVKNLNTECHNQSETCQLLAEIIGDELDESIEIKLPFYTDYGRNIKIGKNVLINFGVSFVSLGGVEIQDDVLIGPGATVISVNHLEDPKHRRDLNLKPVLIKKGAWIGANANILPGVTVGENAIVGAGSIVTKDVADNAIVVGNPAKEVRKIKENEND